MKKLTLRIKPPEGDEIDIYSIDLEKHLVMAIFPAGQRYILRCTGRTYIFLDINSGNCSAGGFSMGDEIKRVIRDGASIEIYKY